MKGINIKKSGNGEVEARGEISIDAVAAYIPFALSRLRETFELPGFRKGTVPDEILRAHFGSKKIFEKAAERALGEVLSSLIAEHKLKIIAAPETFITKLEESSPVEFLARFLIVPEFELPDYLRIAKNIPADDALHIGKDEIDKVLLALLKNRNREPAMQSSGDTSGITDEFAQSVGNFKNAEELRAQIERNLLAEKQADKREKRRAEIIEAVLAKTKITLSERLVDREVARMNSQFEHELSHAGTTFDEYVKNAKKTKEEIYEAWRPAAQRRIKTQLVIEAIAERERLSPTKEGVEAETRALIARYSELNIDHAREYVIMALTNELVFRFLEK